MRVWVIRDRILKIYQNHIYSNHHNSGNGGGFNKSHHMMHNRLPPAQQQQRQQKVSAFTQSALSSSRRLTKTAQRIYEDILPMIRQFSTEPQMHWKKENPLRLNESILSRVSRGATPTIKKRTAMDDHVSKNISMLLEDLLKSYESSQTPSHSAGIPTVVRTNILIRSMGPVSELEMEYSMDCYFRQYWQDKRLSFKGPIKSLSLSIKVS